MTPMSHRLHTVLEPPLVPPISPSQEVSFVVRFRAVVVGSARISGQVSHDDGATWETFSIPIREAWIRAAFVASETAARRLWALQDALPGLLPEDTEWDPHALLESSPDAQRRMFSIAIDAVSTEAFADQYGLATDAVTEWLRANKAG